MINYLVSDSDLTSIANTIRTKGGTSGSLIFPNGFNTAINNISGGGGGGDFSTAEVTVIGGGIDVDDAYPEIYICALVNDEIVSYVPLEENEISIDVILYKGEQGNIYLLSQVGNSLTSDDFSVTGNITVDEESFYITITGNGTITIS